MFGLYLINKLEATLVYALAYTICVYFFLAI